MKDVKQFLIGFVLVYFLMAIPTQIAFGPPGFSKDYLEKHRPANDRYYEIIKSEHYKLYEERPELAARDKDAFVAAHAELRNWQQLEEEVAFVEEHEAMPEFQAEQARRYWFDRITDFLNVIAVIVLVVGLGRKPIVGFLDGQITTIREKLDKAAQGHQEAARQLAHAETRAANIESELAEIRQQAEEQAQRTVAEIEASTGHILAELAQDLEQRKQMAAQRVAMEMKREIVEKAIAQAQKTLLETRTEERMQLMITQFLAGLEKAK